MTPNVNHLYSLRTLSPLIPILSLVDLTIGYPGPRAPYWPEDYYDLTVWFTGVAPPSIHIHLRKWDVRTQVPLGNLEAGGEGTDEEKKVFDEWLRARWAEKDVLLERFVSEGSFFESGEKEVGVGEEEKKGGRLGEVVWEVELRRWWENFAGLFLVWLVVLIVLAGAVGFVVRALGVGSGAGVAEGAKASCGCAKMRAAAGEL